jgi:hypothetical protein
MNRVNFVDQTGQPVYGVIALRGNVPVAGSGGESFLEVEDGSYTFKMLGFKDYQSDVYGDEEIALEEVSHALSEVQIFGAYQHKTWILALFMVLVVVAISKIRE